MVENWLTQRREETAATINAKLALLDRALALLEGLTKRPHSLNDCIRCEAEDLLHSGRVLGLTDAADDKRSADVSG